MTSLLPARVRVPCSTSNLGSGYDTIGLALDRYLDASFVPDGRGRLTLERSGTLTSLDDDSDLVASTFSGQLAESGIEPSGVLTIHSEIPVARGLGSSAGAVLAGFDLARAARGEPRDDVAAFSVALALEGHGDNAAPSLFGGLRAVARNGEGPIVLELPLSERVGFAYAAPAVGISTKKARRILPEMVPHEVAAASLGRLAALTRGLAEADPELVRVGMHDELHVPYRLPLIPGGAEAIEAGVEAGAWAVTISGAGSGLIAVCAPEDAERVAGALRAVLDTTEDATGCIGLAVRPDTVGLTRIGEAKD